MSNDLNQKPRGWLLPEKRKNEAPGLYVVSTPIGNLGDITLRALDILSSVDAVICEDTRESGKLLAYYGIKKQLVIYNDHSAGERRGPIIERLRKGEMVAIISDAGTPLISDPGYKLVRACLEDKIPVTVIPGANAILPALQLSGLPSDCFSFIGFLPPKQAARKTELLRWKNAGGTILAYETAPRLIKALHDILDVLGDRDGAVVREITKMFEESRRGKISELIAHYEREGAPKGEIVLAIAPGEQEITEEDAEKQLKRALKTMGTKEAAVMVAEMTGRPRKELYNLALKLAKS